MVESSMGEGEIVNNSLTTAERLRKLIEDKHITYVELERLSGVPKSAIQRYASGDTKKIPLDRIFRISDALGVSPFDIVGMDHPWDTDQSLGLEWARWDFGGRESSESQIILHDPQEAELVNIYRDLNTSGQTVLMGTARGLAANPDMKKDDAYV